MVARVYGGGVTGYWLFEPDDPKPVRAPLIVFNHGWSAMSPWVYGAWIDHMVRRGNIVVFPIYQTSLQAPPVEFHGQRHRGGKGRH